MVEDLLHEKFQNSVSMLKSKTPNSMIIQNMVLALILNATLSLILRIKKNPIMCLITLMFKNASKPVSH